MSNQWPLILMWVLSFSISNTIVCALKNITVDDTDRIKILYTGVWTKSPPNIFDYGGTHSKSINSSAIAAFTFTGVGVYYMSSLWPYSVTTQIALDGGPPITLNLSSSAAETTPSNNADVPSAVIWGESELLNTQHTLVVSMAPGGDYVEVDAFIYTILDQILTTDTPTTSSSATITSSPQPTTTGLSGSDKIALGIGLGMGCPAAAAAIWQMIRWYNGH